MITSAIIDHWYQKSFFRSSRFPSIYRVSLDGFQTLRTSLNTFSQLPSLRTSSTSTLWFLYYCYGLLLLLLLFLYVFTSSSKHVEFTECFVHVCYSASLSAAGDIQQRSAVFHETWTANYRSSSSVDPHSTVQRGRRHNEARAILNTFSRET